MSLLWAIARYLVFVVCLPALLLHPKVRHGFKARCGYLSPILNKGPGLRIWLHGASAGDVRALVPLAKSLRAQRPTIQIFISTLTNTGLMMAQRFPNEFDAVFYLPYDLPGPVNRVLKHIQPDALILEYLELWPTLMTLAKKQGVAIVLHNGRFSPKHLWRYRFLFAITGNLLRLFNLLLLRNTDEVMRAQNLGSTAPAYATGNTKWDHTPTYPTNNDAPNAKMMQHICNPKGYPLWVAGSTHPQEEHILLDAFTLLRARHKNLRMVIAPRYIHRAADLCHAIKARGYGAALKTDTHCGDTNVIILNTIGDLNACYAIADVVFVGGSLVKRGGHNIIEPAAHGKPVVFGPHMGNNQDAMRILLGHGGLMARNAEELYQVLHTLLSHCDIKNELGQLAKSQVMQQQGAANKNAASILGLDLLQKRHQRHTATISNP